MKAEELERLITAASAGSEGEVVTRALSRDIRLPHTSGTAVLIIRGPTPLALVVSVSSIALWMLR